MELIDKSEIVGEINRVLNSYDPNEITSGRYALVSLRDFLDTLEVKDANEALRTEYEKGRADVIQATEQWLANSWPKYCDNLNIINDYKDAIKE